MRRKCEGQSRVTDPGPMETFTDEFNSVTAPLQMERESEADCKKQSRTFSLQTGNTVNLHTKVRLFCELNHRHHWFNLDFVGWLEGKGRDE